MKDVVIVGGGLAGLSAAWRLRDWDIALLEADETRIGGRVHSESRGPYVLNWGGHMYAGSGSSTEQLVHETGSHSMTIPGSLQAMAMNGKFLSTGPIQTYPFRIPMKQRDRLAILRSGAKLSLDVFRYAAAVRTRKGELPEQRQQRVFDFENGRTFAEYMGRIPKAAKDFYFPVVMRSTADPDQIAAGAGIGYFSLIWNIGEGLGNAIVGGASTLTEGIAQTISDSIELGAAADEVVQHADHVVVRYTKGGTAHELKARTVVMATPAPITHRVAVDLPEDLRDALSKIEYGPHVAGAFLTNEEGPMPYDSAYGIATPNRSFTVALNHGNLVHGKTSVRRPGGSMMTFSPASLGRRLFDKPEEEIIDIHLKDLDEIFPGFKRIVTEAHIEKFEFGSPFCFPGRSRLQPTLTQPTDRVFLAGDFLGTLYTETAISSGFTAAQRARSALTAESDASYA
ncbi:NAD(P)/FAD-dependent oxidoreductase [Gulosibacter sp. 10]|uniref:protoporphyrinogen/coproporphyrinogen oxidase n=1 Tax=Gulosibacter sp. 10 TaxID=1255570 RepID=UPI001C3CE3E5|nr:FAD-dependent oxidoreductase [Gulosibacter sp. 10]